MSFNTWTFALFFLLVYGLYLSPLSWRGKKIMLLCAGYFFYGWANPYGPLLVFVSTWVDYLCGLSMERQSDPRKRKLFLAVGLITNLGVLAVFKYFNFFSENVVIMLNALGMHADPVRVKLAMLVGLSFYTFQKISYLADVYKKKIPPAHSFVDYALFVCFFPTVMSGPIMRAGQFLPQLATPRVVDYQAFQQGLKWVLAGYFFKVAVADNLAPSVAFVYDSQTHVPPLEAWLGSYYFSAQIFCDFAGYTLIARGIGKMMGFDVPENFRAPYIATGFSNFWGRWHITLSMWLRDYIYIPLGGNRHGLMKTCRNLMFTMLLCGIWHGANWTFVVWGGIHGLYLVAERGLKGIPRWKAALESDGPFISLVKVIVVFHLVTLAWVFFRAHSVGHAMTILYAMFDLKGMLTIQMPDKSILKDSVWLLPVVAYYAWQFVQEHIPRPIVVPESVAMAGLALMTFVTIVCRQASDAFLYFQY